MSGLDSYYTPSSLADKLISFIKPNKVTRAVDFCVGDGKLLKAVAKRYKHTLLYGTDISSEALEKLSNDCPNWYLGQCDFKIDESVNNVPFVKEGLFDLIVLNPPFTCKGSIVEYIVFEGETYRVSTAMLFLMRTLKYMAPSGGLYAILPISCVYSIKDRKAWEYLKKHYNACVLEEPNKVSFTSKCAPNIVLVYVGNYKVKGLKQVDTFDFTSLPVKSIIRGCIRMQNLQLSNSKDAVPLIHTTNLRKGELVGLVNILPGHNVLVKGNGVVIPRVCNPSPDKIVLLNENTTYALSDCVIVIITEDIVNARKVKNSIVENWDDFVIIYKGTGAQYTTLERLEKLFGIVK